MTAAVRDSFEVTAPLALPARTSRTEIIERAYDDYRERRAAGESCPPSEFCARFPSIQHSLRDMIQALEWLDEKKKELSGDFPEPGAALERFGLIVELEIGVGAFSKVYLAYEPKLERHVVVKMTRGAAEEARKLARLAHDAVIPVFWIDDCVEGGWSLICMPYRGVATLKDVLDHLADNAPRDGLLIARVAAGPETAHEPSTLARSYNSTVLTLGLQLAEALAYVHSRRVEHRDLKPSNVLLGFDGRPQLIDFNLARDCNRGGVHIGGTVPYMAPEQLAAFLGESSKTVDGRGDIFSLAVILHELLAGRHPWVGGDALLTGRAQAVRLREQHAKGLPALANVSASVQQLLHDCTAVSPSARPTAAQLVVRLSRLLSERWYVRHAGTMATVAASIVAFFTVAAMGAMRPETSASTTAVVSARQALAAGDFARAEDLLRKLDPDERDPSVLSARVFANLRLNNCGRAANLAAASAKLKSLDGIELNNYGLAQVGIMGRVDAMASFDAAVALDPVNPAIRFNRLKAGLGDGVRRHSTVPDCDHLLGRPDVPAECFVTVAATLITFVDHREEGVTDRIARSLKLLAAGGIEVEPLIQLARERRLTLAVPTKNDSPRASIRLNEWSILDPTAQNAESQLVSR